MTRWQRIATAYIAVMALGCLAWGIWDATRGRWWLAGAWVFLAGIWALIAAFPWLVRRRRTITIDFVVFPNIKNGETHGQTHDHH